MPLSTLHGSPRDDPRKTRGQDGSLLLSCKTLAFSTFCRFSPAHRLWPSGGIAESLGQVLEGVRRAGFLWGAVGGVNKQKASCPIAVVARRRWCRKRSVAACYSKPPGVWTF